MSNRRIPNWLLLILAPVALVLLIPLLWVLSSVTTTPLHPNPESVPTVMRSAPLPEWTGAIEQARQIVRARAAGDNLPGLSVAVGVNGDLVWTEGFGFADLSHSVPVTPEHRFRIGTASTVLTSAAAGLLIENGRLKLEDDIRAHVPEFPDKGQPLTLRELMGHTRSVMPDDNDERPLFTQHCERPVEAVQHFSNWILHKPNSGDSVYDWILVSAAIEAAADQPFVTFLRERVFDPLEMRDTIADPMTVDLYAEDFPLATLVVELIYDPAATRGTNSPPDTSNVPAQGPATLYSTRFRSDPNYGMHVARPMDYSCYAGSSVFLSTPSDLVRFGMAIEGGKLLQPATVELLQVPSSGEETDYALGWDSETVMLGGRQTRAIGHNGEVQGGMVASLLMFPGYGIVVAVTSNVVHADTFSLAVKIAEAFAK